MLHRITKITFMALMVAALTVISGAMVGQAGATTDPVPIKEEPAGTMRVADGTTGSPESCPTFAPAQTAIGLDSLGQIPQACVYPQIQIWVSPSQIPYGGSTTVYWNITNADRNCTSEGFSVGAVSGSSSGSQAVGPLYSNKRFSITCYNSTGTFAENYADVVVSSAPPPPTPTCRDGVDNDGDGYRDYGNDPDCSSTEDAEDRYDAPPPSSPTDNASFVSQSVPATMTAGSSYTVSVTMRNSGTSSWTAGGNYRLGSQNTQDNSIWGMNRVLLPSSVTIVPGQSHSFMFNVKAPSAAGTYNFQWRMVKEGVAWFGGTSSNVAITVATSTPSPSTGSVVTLAPTNITNDSALLRGTVNPGGLDTGAAWQGQYNNPVFSGPRTDRIIPVGAGTVAVAVNTTAYGLDPAAYGLSRNNPWYFRLCATNSAGTVCGGTVAFCMAGVTTCNYASIPPPTCPSGVQSTTSTMGVATSSTGIIKVKENPTSIRVIGIESSTSTGGGVSPAKADSVESTGVTTDCTPPAAPKPTASLSASATSIKPGASVRLTWSSTDATSCGASGSWSGTLPTSGWRDVTPEAPTVTYTVVCSGSGGTSLPSSVTVALIQPTGCDEYDAERNIRYTCVPGGTDFYAPDGTNPNTVYPLALSSKIPPPAPYRGDRDYCSDPAFNPVGLFGGVFNVACYNHDVCYGSQLGRKYCDVQIWKDMSRACRDKFSWWLANARLACLFSARSWYYAVRQFGGSHYKPRKSSLEPAGR